MIMPAYLCFNQQMAAWLPRKGKCAETPSIVSDLVPYFLNLCIFWQDIFACPLKCLVAMGFRGKYFYLTFQISAFWVPACPA
jgi:hypothetical protein